jgi:dTDP-4-amino-4,6-dideoxygalactose transaminase
MTEGNGIPFLDLVTPHLELEEQLVDAVRGVLRTAGFIGGPVLEAFEKEFAAYCNVEHCVGVASGTDALRFALMAAGVGSGDAVITVPNTFVATVEAIVQAGAWPRFVDVDRQTFNISVDAVKDYIQNKCYRSDNGALVDRETKRTVKAILPVHLYGQMCDMDALEEICSEHGLLLFEDACQAHGAEYFSAKKRKWLKAGSIGKAGAFSFYPGKNLGACGEAGAITTNDAELAQRMRMIRDHGQNKKYYHLVEGYNGRLDTMQAALLRVKLPHLAEWTSKRRKAAASYNKLFARVYGVRAPFEPTWSKAVYHLYVVCTQQRDELQKHLTSKNIGTGLHYPIPLHLQKGYANLGYAEGDFPVTEQLSREILSLPMFPQLSYENQQRVVQEIQKFREAVEMSPELASR